MTRMFHEFWVIEFGSLRRQAYSSAEYSSKVNTASPIDSPMSQASGAIPTLSPAEASPFPATVPAT